MKVLHVTNAIGWSGGLEQMVLLISELQKKGHRNVIICPPNSEAITKLTELDSPANKSWRENDDGVDVVIETLPMTQEYDLFTAWKLNRLIRKYQPEIVHAHHPLAHSLALVALSLPKMCSRPLPARHLTGGRVGYKNEDPALVVSRRVSFPIRKNPFSKWKYRSRRIQKIVAVSQAVREILVQGGVNASCIEVIYSAVRLERFFPRSPNLELKKSLQIPEDFSVVGKIANASFWKGQHIFLQAAQQCIKKNPKLKLCFILAGRDTEKLASDVKKLGLSEHVRLLGMRSDVPEILSLLDLSVNSAIFGEGLSGALRESLAMEVPVIASDVAGNAELVQDGVTGFVVAIERADLLAEKIIYALENYSLSKELAKRGRGWILKNATMEVMVEKQLQLYHSLLHRS